MRQGKKFTLLGPARHQVIAGAFRRRPGKDGGFDIKKAAPVQVITDGPGDPGAQLDVVLHRLPAQVHVAVTQADIILHVFIIQLKRRRFGLVQDFQGVPQHFHFTGSQVRVDGALRAPAYPAGDTDHEFIPERLCKRKRFGPVGVVDHLGQTVPVAQVNEDHAAVVAAPVYPAAQRDLLADQAGRQLSTIMTAHGSLHRCCRVCQEAAEAGASAAAGSRRLISPSGTMTPIEMMNLNPSSTDMSSSMISRCGISRLNPEVGFGVVGR